MSNIWEECNKKAGEKEDTKDLRFQLLKLSYNHIQVATLLQIPVAKLTVWLPCQRVLRMIAVVSTCSQNEGK